MMQKFDHPHVIHLIGICLDAGPPPYIVLPFMENGSLLSYVKKNRRNLLTSRETDEDKVCIDIWARYLANLILIYNLYFFYLGLCYLKKTE